MDFSKFNIIIPPQDIEQHPQCLMRIARGDRKAYEWLYKNYCSKLYDYIQLLTNDKALAEDIVQEAFIRIWTKRDKLTEVTHFNSYLYSIAKNLLRDKWRKDQTEKAYLKTVVQDHQPSEHSLFYQRLEEQLVNSAIKRLSPRQQMVYRLIREEGQTREMVSRLLKISPNTVKATMQNALGQLRKELRG